VKSIQTEVDETFKMNSYNVPLKKIVDEIRLARSEKRCHTRLSPAVSGLNLV
jgi:hypothetical protein